MVLNGATRLPNLKIKVENLPPTRYDIPVELDVTTDGSGGYTSAWFDSTNIAKMAFTYGPYFGGPEVVTIEGSIDGVNALPQSSIAPTLDTVIPFRYFRVKLTGGTANAEWWIVGRSLP